MARLDLAASFYGGPGFTLYHAWGENSATSYRPHFHDEYLVGCQLRGYEDFQVSGKMERFGAGDLVLINPHQVHTGNVHANRDLEYISIYVDREVVERIADELEAPTKSPEFTIIKSPDDGICSRLMLTLLERMRSDRRHARKPGARVTPGQFETQCPTPPASDEGGRALASHGSAVSSTDPRAAGSSHGDMRLEQECCLHDLVVASIEKFSNLRYPMLRSSNRIGHRKIARAVEFMHDLASSEVYREVDLNALASTAELSKYHFLRQFSQTVGMTPGAYMRTIRLARAAKKLRSRSLPILDIALSIGFSDHPSFSRAFARYMGMTPSEYQRLGAPRRHCPPMS